MRSILESTGRRVRAAWIAFSIASSFFLYEFLTRVEPSLAAADIAHYFGLSNAGFGTLSSVFFWVYAPMQIVVGLLLDRYGARRFVLLGSLVCATGVFVLTATPVPVVGALGRALTGFGASFAFVSALWLVNHWFAPERFAVLSGGVNAVGMLGTAAGTVALSGFIATAGWRTVFYLTGAAGLLIFVVALALLREPHSPAATATSAPREHVGRSISGVMGNTRTWMIAIVGLLFYMPINVYGGLWGTTELVEERGLSQTAAETTVSMIFWGMAAGSVLGGWVSDRLGHRKYLVFAGAMLSGLAYVAVLFLPGTLLQTRILLLAAGFFGGLQMLTFAMAKEGQPNRLVGTVVAFVNMVGIGGALVFQPLVGIIADATGGNFRIALSTAPICAFVAAVLVLFVSEYRHPDHQAGARTPRAKGDAPVAEA